jgi:TolA-binding protein
VKLSPAALTWRGDSAENPFLRDLKPGLDAYRAEAYADAESHFANLAARYPRAIEAQFFLGAVRMMRNDFAGAVVPLTAAVALKEPTFQDDAMWYLAVAEQRSGRAAEARQRLAALCNGSGTRAADACQAQERLGPAPALPRP